MKLFEIEERSVLSVMGQQPSHYDGNLDWATLDLTSLVGSPQTVSGDFYCYNNKLTSLVGGPQSVGGNFYCRDNNLVSLEGCPRSVGGRFSCYDNNIKSFHNIHKSIKQINGDFVCNKGTHMLGIAFIKGVKQVRVVDDQMLTEIFNKYLHDIHLLQDALLDAGYREQAQL